MQRRTDKNQDEKIQIDESFLNAFQEVKNSTDNSIADYQKEKDEISTLTLKINKKLHMRWKNFANDHYMSVVQLIKNALDYISVEESRGNIKIEKEKIEKL